MEAIKRVSTEHLLDKAQRFESKLSEEEINAAIHHLRQPLQSVSYEVDGAHTVERGGHKIEFSYAAIVDEDRTNLQTYIDVLRRKGANAADQSTTTTEWRKLRELRYSSKGQSIDLLALIPNMSPVFFCPTEDEFQTGAVLSDHGSHKNIFIVGDMATPISVATLLHEIGHIVDQATLDRYEISDLVEQGEDADLAERVRKERAASAFALKAMRPFLDGRMRKDFTIFLEDYALQSYYRNVRSDMSTRASIRHHVMSESYDEDVEYWNNYFYDAWEKWKLTDAYTEWKQRPENQKLNPADEEYGAWRSWVESTKYDFEKDLHHEA